MLVLASGQVLRRTEDKSINVRTVTLAVTPEQADSIVAAHARGTLSLSLRGLDDHSLVKKPETRPVLVAVADLPPSSRSSRGWSASAS